jgi:hypothetical protein
MTPSTNVPTRQAVPAGPDDAKAPTGAPLVPLWRLNLLRVGYLFVAGGIFATQWPTVIQHDPSWPLMEGVKTSMLAAVSVLALLGLRYPLQMVPILLFEVTWKVIWGAAVAVPLWTAGQLDPATQQVAADCLPVVIVLAVLPWRHLIAQYVMKPGDRWRSR